MKGKIEGRQMNKESITLVFVLHPSPFILDPDGD